MLTSFILADTGALTLAEGVVLVSWYKPILMILPFLGWGWVISSIYDKDAARWYFQRQTWNLGHMLAGVVALVLMLAPSFGALTFWAMWPAAMVVLVADLLLYYFLRNADDRVPAHHKWSLDPAKLLGAAAQGSKRKKRKAGDAELVFSGPNGELEPPDPEAQPVEHEIRLNAEELIKAMLDQRGSRLEIGPARDGAYVAAVMVDGLRAPVGKFTPDRGAGIVTMFKAAAGLDVEDRRRPQSGELQVGAPGAKPMKLGLSTIGGQAGMKAEMIVEPESQVQLRLKELGLHPNQLEDARSMIDEEKGVVLQVAPPHGGRTTTFYALIREHDAYLNNVQTLETDPVTTVEGVRCNEYDPRANEGEFSTTVRSILRRDPDVVGVAEFPDADTAKEIARSDHDRTRVYLSFNASDVNEAMSKYLQAVGNERQAAESLHGIVAQRLVRRLCHNCKAPFQPTPDMLKKLGLPGEVKQLFRASGKVLVKDKEETCPVCGGTGYFGQIGVFAVQLYGPEEREAIASGQMNSLRGLLRQKKQQSLQTAALQHVVNGDTTVDEVVRVMEGGSKQRSSRSGGASPAAGAGARTGQS